MTAEFLELFFPTPEFSDTQKFSVVEGEPREKSTRFLLGTFITFSWPIIFTIKMNVDWGSFQDLGADVVIGLSEDIIFFGISEKLPEEDPRMADDVAIIRFQPVREAVFAVSPRRFLCVSRSSEGVVQSNDGKLSCVCFSCFFALIYRRGSTERLYDRWKLVRKTIIQTLTLIFFHL